MMSDCMFPHDMPLPTALALQPERGAPSWQALTAHDELIAATSVMNDMLEAEQMQQMQQERLLADRGLDWAQKIAAVQDHFTDEKV